MQKHADLQEDVHTVRLVSQHFSSQADVTEHEGEGEHCVTCRDGAVEGDTFGGVAMRAAIG